MEDAHPPHFYNPDAELQRVVEMVELIISGRRREEAQTFPGNNETPHVVSYGVQGFFSR